jgi:hypothetical protein
MLRIAFKEWAVICRALAEARQAIILRKGGIAEDRGEFKPEHLRFWLYPTYQHQQQAGVKPAAAELLARTEAERPPEGVLRLSHFAEVAGVYDVRSPAGALVLDDLHLWSEATVRQRFAYRRPGLYVLPVRVYRAAEAFELTERPAYAGCKTWVELDRELPTAGATPVLTDDQFRAVQASLNRRLNPSATV